MNLSLKITSLLLSYPSKELQEGASELKQALQEDSSVSPVVRKLLVDLIDHISEQDLYDAQETYVILFDRTRTLSLHLFEHVHGESRDRGQAMVDLMAMYEGNGLEVDAKELPDYLPLFLEYLSTRPLAEAQEMLEQTLHILVALGKRLEKRDTLYVNAFKALEEIAAAQPDQALVQEMVDQPEDDPTDLEALDRIWEEEVVAFGGGAGEADCGPDRLQRQMRAASRKPDDVARSSAPQEG